MFLLQNLNNSNKRLQADSRQLKQRPITIIVTIISLSCSFGVFVCVCVCVVFRVLEMQRVKGAGNNGTVDQWVQAVGEDQHDLVGCSPQKV